MLKTLRTEWPRLLFDLVVVVAGITISFGLDEWRRDREDRKEERRSWEAIRDNLATDTLYLSQRIRQLDRMLHAYDGLQTGVPADSLDSYMDQAISYVVFTPTQSAFHELEQTSGSRLLRNRRLLAALTSAYTREYVQAKEWDGINRDFIVQRMIPYLDLNAPYVDGTGGGETAMGMSAVYRSVRAKDQFRNLVRTNRLFKDAQTAVYRATLARVITLHNLVVDELRGASPGQQNTKARSS